MSDCSKELEKIFGYINSEKNEKRFINNLRKAVGIKNVSSWKNQQQTNKEFDKMIDFVTVLLKELGFHIKLCPIGNQRMEDNSQKPLPPVILASLCEDKKKKTLLIYGHMDVQPAKIEDGWDQDPFTLTEKDGNLYGRGATDDKGPVFGWFHCIEAFKNSNVPLPVNIKMVLESLEEVGSDGLEDLLKSERNGFLKDVDFVTISDNYWIGRNYPCLAYGLRGLAYFHLTIKGGKKDLHSGVFGGAILEPMEALHCLLSKLTVKGDIKVPGIMDDVAPVTEIEKKLYESLIYDPNDLKLEAGVQKLRYPGDKAMTLMSRWRYPSLSTHGTEGAFSDPGSKTVIPYKVIGKFSIRLVPNQNPTRVATQVKKFIWDEFRKEKYHEHFEMKIEMVHGAKPWIVDPKHPNYTAAANAVKQVYGLQPQFTREGGSIPITLVLQELTKKNVLLLPMGQSDDGAHSQNEKISKRNFICGTKVFAAYLTELGKI